jgi:hypothetical protein
MYDIGCKVEHDNYTDFEIDETVSNRELEDEKQWLLKETRMALLSKGFKPENILYVMASLKDTFRENLESSHDWVKYLRLCDDQIAALCDDDLEIGKRVLRLRLERDYD